MERQAKTFFESVIHLASAARRLPSSFGSDNSKRDGRPGTHASVPGVAGSPGLVTSPRFSTKIGRGVLAGVKLLCGAKSFAAAYTHFGAGSAANCWSI